MTRLAIVAQLKEKKFVSGNLICSLTWNTKTGLHEMDVHSFVRVTRINSLRKKRKFEAANDYITFDVYLKRIGLGLSSENCLKIKKFLRAKQIWINWSAHLGQKNIHSEEAWAV